MICRTLSALAVAASLAAVSARVEAQNGGDVVAEIGGTKVSLAELEQKQGAKLLQASI